MSLNDARKKVEAKLLARIRALEAADRHKHTRLKNCEKALHDIKLRSGPYD